MIHIRCFLATILLVSLTACTSEQRQVYTPLDSRVNGNTGLGASKNVLIDGSGTVSVISEAMKEQFRKVNPNVRIAIGKNGTGDGFTRFCLGVTDISMAARPIKKSEIEACQKNNIEFVELPLALDGISLVVNRTNTWATCLKPQELSKIWESAASGKIVNWNQVRNDYPDQYPLILAGPAVGTGTVDYFSEVIIGKSGKIRNDYKTSEEESVTVQTVASEPGGLGFTSFSRYLKNQNILKALAIENKEGKCVEPSPETIANSSYNPLSRPLFIYVSKTALKENPVVKVFADYHLNAANRSLISESGYVPLPDNLLAKVRSRLDHAIAGSVFEEGSPANVKLADQLASSKQR
ncbi:PstS family phosphate ABC transporter substrate-binding protein [Nostoc sp. LPT]|uniref:PstS family phosphate ABC transporter substrate-binding protein n=1 Tax=Nostoc sp. LPT TaxID=2815387 RepID=UPI001D6350AF|nr:PstS family phosphate ABC transporter substrate-binding protein [Nostoc sp. LPT]MBN4004818.1 PstS family phosphate ABC transporter substrate-binding protein [Nostoc sp. LPT]